MANNSNPNYHIYHTSRYKIIVIDTSQLFLVWDKCETLNLWYGVLSVAHFIYWESADFHTFQIRVLANRFHSSATTINKTPYSKNRTFHRLKPVNPSLRVDNSLVIWIPPLTFQKALHTLNAGFTASPLGTKPPFVRPRLCGVFYFTLGLKDTMNFYYLT